MSSAHLKRLEVHKRFSELDIADWMLDIVHPRKGESLVDLGCGNGEQLLRFMKHIGTGTEAFAIDTSKEGLARLSERLSTTKYRVRIVRGSMDRFLDFIPVGSRFDIMMSNFAIYYSKSPEKIIRCAAEILSSGGRLFLSGPAFHNNYELIALYCRVTGKKPERYLPTVMEQRTLRAVRAHFPETRTFLFRNPVNFPSAKSLIDYWRSYYLYNPKYEKKFRNVVSSHFSNHSTFTTVKEVFGILARR